MTDLKILIFPFISTIKYLTFLKKQQKRMSENIIVELTSIEIGNTFIIILFVTTETAIDKSDSVNYIECGHEIISR